MAPEKIEKPLPLTGLETLSQNRKDEEQKTIHEDSSEKSMSAKIESNTFTRKVSVELDREESKNKKRSDSDKSSVSNSISSNNKKQQSKKEEEKNLVSDNSVASDSESNESSSLRKISISSK